MYWSRFRHGSIIVLVFCACAVLGNSRRFSLSLSLKNILESSEGCAQWGSKPFGTGLVFSVQVPNMAILMLSYEIISDLLNQGEGVASRVSLTKK